MTQSFRKAFYLAALTVTPMLWSCGKNTPTDTLHGFQAAAEDEIRNADSARAEALRTGDAAALAKMYSDDFMMITPSGEIRTKQDQLRDISRGGVQHRVGENRILRLRVYGKVAVVQREGRGELVLNGVADDLIRRYTRVYVKKNGQWQLTATHMSRVAAP